MSFILSLVSASSALKKKKRCADGPFQWDIHEVKPPRRPRSKVRLRRLGYDADDKISARSRPVCISKPRFRSRDLLWPRSVKEIVHCVYKRQIGKFRGSFRAFNKRITNKRGEIMLMESQLTFKRGETMKSSTQALSWPTKQPVMLKKPENGVQG